MNYAQIRKYDVANGEGIRTTLFVSGCHFNCPGCFNKEYQDFSFGKEFTDDEMQKFIDLGKNPSISGFSFLGGEPLDFAANSKSNQSTDRQNNMALDRICF